MAVSACAWELLLLLFTLSLKKINEAWRGTAEKVCTYKVCT
jgi:hypothetical protein